MLIHPELIDPTAAVDNSHPRFILARMSASAAICDQIVFILHFETACDVRVRQRKVKDVEATSLQL